MAHKNASRTNKVKHNMAYKNASGDIKINMVYKNASGDIKMQHGV